MVDKTFLDNYKSNRYYVRCVRGLTSIKGLKSGWNLVSVYYSPPNSAIDEMLSSLAGSYTVVWSYQNNQWLFYDPALPATALTPMSSNTLTIMEPGYGYWIDMTEPKTFSFKGTAAPLQISLKKGWNLVGFNSARSFAITDALESIAQHLEVVWSYQNNQWLMYSPLNPLLNNLDTMKPGFGYWIRVNQACDWKLE